MNFDMRIREDQSFSSSFLIKEISSPTNGSQDERRDEKEMRKGKEEQLCSLLPVTASDFILLFNHWIQLPDNMTRHRIRKNIQSCIYAENIVNMIHNCCEEPPTDPDLSNRLADRLVTLPDAVANAYKNKTPDAFKNERYFRRLCQILLLVLSKVREKVTQNMDQNLSIVRTIISRLLIRGQDRILWSELLTPLAKESKNCGIWNRITYSVLMRYNLSQSQSVEPLIRLVMCRSVDPDDVTSLMGDVVKRDQKIRFILTDKLINMCCFNEPLMPVNLMSYLNRMDRTAFEAAFDSAITCWSSVSSVKHRSFLQNRYIYSLLMAGLRFVKHLPETKRQELHVRIVKGMETHINSTNSDLRSSGLFVGQQLLNSLGIDVPQLNLQIEEDETIRFLKRYLNHDFIVDDLPTSEARPVKLIEELDDEMEELDIEDEDPVLEKKPVFLLDCLQGLQESEDDDWRLVCMSCIESLIRKNRKTAADLHDDILRSVLYFNHESDQRIPALVAVTTCAPRQVAKLLIDEFYNRNIALCLRLDILDVLAKAAAEIRSGVVTGVVEKNQTVPSVVPPEVGTVEQNWRQIVDQRIAMKTKRTHTVPVKPEATANPFAPVAADFFFPLIQRFDGKDIVFVVRDFDAILLTRLIFTLGLMLDAASQQVISRRMGSALLDFILQFRHHNDPLVRRSVAFAFSVILTSVPSSTVLYDMKLQIMRMKEWLISRHSDETDEEAKKAITSALFLLNELIENEKLNPVQIVN